MAGSQDALYSLGKQVNHVPLMRIGLVAALLAYASQALAWEAEVKAVNEVEGLEFSGTKKSVYLPHNSCHYGEYSLTCELRDLPEGAVPSFQWTAVCSENAANPLAGAIWVPAPGTAPSTVG